MPSTRSQAPKIANHGTNQALPQPTSFQFVPFTNLGKLRDPAALSRIRRHAMKDIGLQRRKPKKRNVCFKLDVPESFGTSAAARFGHTSLELPDPVPAIGGGSIHTFFPIPVELDETGKRLLSNIWDSDDSISRQTAHRPDWFTVSIADAATFYQALANSELHLEVIRSPHRSPVARETATSITYHQKAVSIQRKRLANLASTKVTEEMIGTASGLVAYAEISGGLEWWLPQRKGMVDLIRAFQGGFEALDTNRKLRATCSWVELRGAFVQDIPSAMPLPRQWVVEYERNIDSGAALWAVQDPELRLAWTNMFDQEPEWLQIFDAVASLGSIVSSRLQSGNTQQDDVILWTNVIAHRLLELRPLDNISESNNDDSRYILEICRLTMLMFIAVVYRKYGAHPTDVRILIRKQQHLLTSTSAHWTGLEKLKTWAKLISALEAASYDVMQVPADAVREWIREKQLALSILVPGPDSLASVKQVLWLPELLDLKVESFVDGLWVENIWNQQ